MFNYEISWFYQDFKNGNLYFLNLHYTIPQVNLLGRIDNFFSSSNKR